MAKPFGSIVSLPADAVCVNCTMHRFEPQFIYKSVSANFTGTEDQFYDAGKAEAYVQIGNFQRRYFHVNEYKDIENG